MLRQRKMQNQSPRKGLDLKPAPALFRAGPNVPPVPTKNFLVDQQDPSHNSFPFLKKKKNSITPAQFLLKLAFVCLIESRAKKPFSREKMV